MGHSLLPITLRVLVSEINDYLSMMLILICQHAILPVQHVSAMPNSVRPVTPTCSLSTEPAQLLALPVHSRLKEHAFPAIQTARPAPEALLTNATHALHPVPSSHPADASLHALDPSFWTLRRQAVRVATNRVLRASMLDPMHVWHVLMLTRCSSPEPASLLIARPPAALCQVSVSVCLISSSRTHHHPHCFPSSYPRERLQVIWHGGRSCFWRLAVPSSLSLSSGSGVAAHESNAPRTLPRLTHNRTMVHGGIAVCTMFWHFSRGMTSTTSEVGCP